MFFTLEFMIASWRHKGLKDFFETGSKKGIQPKHAKRLSLQLATLNAAVDVNDMGAPGWNLHPLKGEGAGLWSVWVNGNWRLTFKLENGNAELVDYRDYH